MSSLTTACWCGSRRLGPFSERYLRCVDCETLCAANLPDAPSLAPRVEEPDLYGRNSLERVAEGSALPRLEERAREELAERCPYWLRALLRRKSPPGRVLEVGCRYGGLVALLRAAGFDATGLELSPGLAQAASQRFDIPVLAGPLDSQKIVPGSLDAVVLFDVLQQLRNPVETIRNCLALLKGDGIFLIQTPRYPEALGLRTMQQVADPFLHQLEHEEYLHLFSRSSIELFFRRLGVPYVQFEPAGFCPDEMFLAAGRTALADFSDGQIASFLAARPSRRLALALIDVDGQRRDLQYRNDELLRKGTSPLEITLRRLKHSYVFGAMRMLGLWEWLETGLYRRPGSPDATGRPSQDLRQGEHRGD